MDELEMELDSLRNEIIADNEKEETADKTVDPDDSNEDDEDKNLNPANISDDDEDDEESEEDEESEDDKESEEESKEDKLAAKNEDNKNVKDKPRKSKNKVPYAKRISEINSKYREAERNNKQLQMELEKLKKLVTGEDKPKTRADFVDDKEFNDYQIQTKVDERFAQQNKNNIELQKVESEKAFLSNKYQENVDAAEKIYPDVKDILETFNEDINLSGKSKKHLLASPAGVYTMYKIAKDYNLNEELSKLPVQKVEAIVGKIHNEIYNNLKNQSSQKKLVEKKSKPKPPKREQSSTVTDFSELEGEDFIEAYNKKFNS